jgi:hypothetical protein
VQKARDVANAVHPAHPLDEVLDQLVRLDLSAQHRDAVLDVDVALWQLRVAAGVVPDRGRVEPRREPAG